MGLARKGRWGGKAMVAPARAMYWMKSTWEVSPSSCSMLSLAARCLWKWCRLGEPLVSRLDARWLGSSFHFLTLK